jgi:hypothetical protein
MPVSDKQLLRLAGFPGGINNIARETDLASGQVGDDGVLRGELRIAENIDLTDDGKPQAAPGHELVEALPGLHSLWADPRFGFLLGVYDGNLVRFDTALERAVVVALDHGTQPVSYDMGAGWVYWSNGFESGRVSPDGEASSFAPEHPNGFPALAVIPNGGLHAGTYAVAVCFVDQHGRHGGACLATEVDVAEGQGVRLTAIPQPARADTVKIRIAMTKADGRLLRRVQDVPVGTTSFNIGTHTPGPLLRTDFLEPLPAGQCIATFNARTLVFRGKGLYIGEAMRYGLGNLAKSYLGFPAEGVLLAVVGEGGGAGVYAATAAGDGREGSTYYLGGEDPGKWTRRRCYPHGAVRGSLSYALAKHLRFDGVDPDLRVPVWLADDGQLVAGLPGGTVRQLHSDRYEALVRPERAATAVREYRGLRTVLSSLRGGTVGRLRVIDSASAERWRDGRLVPDNE